MNVLGIYGSPRKGGNSDLLLQQALAGARDAGGTVKEIFARDLNISGCQACGGCDKTGACILKDDMQPVYTALDHSRMIILSTPVFFYGFPAQLKALIDRAQARWSKRMLEKSNAERQKHNSGSGYLIAVGATGGKNLFAGMELSAKYFFDALDKDYQGGLFFRGVDKKGAIIEHPEAQKQAFELGRHLIHFPL